MNCAVLITNPTNRLAEEDKDSLHEVAEKTNDNGERKRAGVDKH